MDATAIKAVPPIYPLSAALRGTEGRVTLAFIIDTQGKARDIRVVDSRPQGIFDEYAEEALAGSLFRPEHVRGTARAAAAKFTYLFRVRTAGHCEGMSPSAAELPLAGLPPHGETANAAANSERIGYVTLAFTIDETGRPRNVTVRDSYPPGEFDRAARADLLQSHFRPRCIHGKIEPVPATYTYTFRVH